jgi:Fic family protein
LIQSLPSSALNTNASEVAQTPAPWARSTKDPGEFRRSQNWIGGTRPGNALTVPPPVTEMTGSLNAFERFMNNDQSRLPALIKAGLLHVQFETIHPFLNGNGRIGRLLVTLYLCMNGVLQKPLLYLSLYLKSHRRGYYRLLQEVRENGKREAWLDFFLAGVADTANQAFEAATQVVDLFKEDREKITMESDRAGSALNIHELFQKASFHTANQIVHITGLSAPTVNAALADLERLGIVDEVTGRKRGRVFSHRRYLAILSEGTDPIPLRS